MRAFPLLLAASFAQGGEAPHFNPCGLFGRPGHIDAEGVVQREHSARDFAEAAMETCDFVAWGRFVSVCDENYHRATGVLNAEVTATFAVEDILFGESPDFVRVLLSRRMLVAPDSDLSREVQESASDRERRHRRDAAAAGRELLQEIHQSGSPLTEEQYEELSEAFAQATWRKFRVSRGELARRISEQTFISHGGVDFASEMGAITPERRFLVGFDAPRPDLHGLNEGSTVLFWGQEAEDIAEQIRAILKEGGRPGPETGAWGNGVGEDATTPDKPNEPPRD